MMGGGVWPLFPATKMVCFCIFLTLYSTDSYPTIESLHMQIEATCHSGQGHPCTKTHFFSCSAPVYIC